MKHSDFELNMEFRCGGSDWKVTDIGTRTIIAIKLTGTINDLTWLAGPPYALEEVVFDENDFAGCEVI
jgi:hypothetical protein